MNTWILVLVAILALFALKRLMGGKRMPSTAVKDMISAGAQILDVRSPAEFRSGAYPGAKNIPVQELGNRLNELNPDKPLVIYCASGGRSGMAASLLKQAGFKEVVNAGGLMHMPR